MLLKLDGAGRCLPKLGCIEDHGAERMILEYSKYLAVLARETLVGLEPKPAPAKHA